MDDSVGEARPGGDRSVEAVVATDPDVAGLTGLAGFDAFYGRHRPQLVAVCVALMRSGPVGEEIAQESLFTAYRRWAHVSALDRPDLWVRRVAVNLCTSAWRRRQAEARANRSHHLAVASSYGLAEVDDELWAAVAELPARQRAAMTLHYIDQHTTEEIGSILGCSASTAQTHLERARRTLRKALRPDPPEHGEVTDDE